MNKTIKLLSVAALCAIFAACASLGKQQTRIGSESGERGDAGIDLDGGVQSDGLDVAADDRAQDVADARAIQVLRARRYRDEQSRGGEQTRQN